MDDRIITINPEVGKCYEYQYTGEMREKDEWKYAGRFIKRTTFESYNRNNLFLNDHFDNQNYEKYDGPELRPSLITDNVTKAEGSNFKVKQAWRYYMLDWNRTDI